jgi:hypothetical protein
MMNYNTSVILCSDVIDYSFEDSPVGLKDFSYKAITNKVAGISKLIDPLIDRLEIKKYILIDFFDQALKPNGKTCVNTGWHLDGSLVSDDREQYVIWADGEFRTQFATPFSSEILIDKNNKQSSFDNIIGSSSFSIFEVENKKPIIYDSFAFHKGREVDRHSHRLFCRVMTSNLIKPKNHVFY